MKNFLKKLYPLIPFKIYLFNILKKLFNIPEGIYKHLHFKGVISVNIEDKKFKLHHFGYMIENEIFWVGIENAFEKISFKLWTQLSKRSEVIIDIGANTGVYSILSNAVNKNAKVYGFEPVERVKKRFEKNIKLNNSSSKIKAFSEALSNSDGKATIYDSMEDHIYSVTVSKDLSSDNVKTYPVEINTKRLDTFIQEYKIDKIDLIKIDVETHEPEVIEGMGYYIEKFKPSILIEILSDEIGERIQKLLDGKGYLYYHIDEINDPKLVTKINKSEFFNYLVCQKEIAKYLGLKIL
jgi:FkbM family methyltransferase